MKKEEAFAILEKAEGMSKEEVKSEFGSVEPVRMACGMIRDMSKVEPKVAKQAYKIYKVIKSKAGGLAIMKKLAEKAGIEYKEEVAEKEPKKVEKKEAKKAPEKKPAKKEEPVEEKKVVKKKK